MPTSSTDYEKVPVNRNRRREILRAARLGQRVTVSAPSIGDAARVVDAVAATTRAWTSSEDSFPVTVRSAWAQRSDEA